MLRTARARKKYLRGKKHELHPSHGKGVREPPPLPRREEPHREKDREERNGNNKGKGKEAPKKHKKGPPSPPPFPTPPPPRGLGGQEGRRERLTPRRTQGKRWKGREGQNNRGNTKEAESMLEEDHPNHRPPPPSNGEGQVEERRRNTNGTPRGTRRTEGKEASTFGERWARILATTAESALSMLVSATGVMLSSLSRLGSWAREARRTIKAWQRQDTRPGIRGKHPWGEQPKEARSGEEEHTKEEKEKEGRTPLPPFWPPIGDG
jgi:hypothetical protein